ncbi:hypothetical protein K501DRAFT_333424 [Backusella circina FSU 941]|nr:hypothetical protein K501DRAFT_333424 [Backusella circina FSU 941]
MTLNAISSAVRSTALQIVKNEFPLEDSEYWKTMLPMQPVYYERLDSTTLQAMIELTKENVIMLFSIVDQKEGVVKYKHIHKYASPNELHLALDQTSSTIEEADRLYYMKTNRVAITTASEITNEVEVEDRDAPNDYWGDWSSDEETNNEKEINIHHSIEDSEDSDDDDYYNRWSKEPGTLTPALNEQGGGDGRILHSFDDHNAPKEVDKETAALSELTHILTSTIPNPTKRPLNHTINPLPKVVLRSMLIDNSDEHGLFIHNLRNLIITAKELGYKGEDIVDIVDKLANE